MKKPVTVVISGSFRKYMDDIRNLIIDLQSRGIKVLKPDLRPTVENKDNPEFVIFSGEEGVHPWKLETDYFDAVEKCDAHIVFNPNSYLGQSAEMELGTRLHGVEYTTGKNKGKKPMYLLEKPNPENWIKEARKFADVDDDREYEIRFFCDFLNGLIENGFIKVGLDTFYHDFGIKDHSSEKIEGEGKDER